MEHPNDPPPNYKTPPFPSLNVRTLADPTPQRMYTLYYLTDIWRFTLVWTLITYALFHLSAVLVAMVTHGWKKSSWSYIWAVPVVYLVVAGLEALLAGSVVGLVYGSPGLFWCPLLPALGPIDSVGFQMSAEPEH